MSPTTPRVIPPSDEVAEEALRRARELDLGLYPHQVEGIAFLLGRRRAILADDMGLGKTRQAIVAMTEAEPKGPYLVVCPAWVKRHWCKEIEKVGSRVGSAAAMITSDAGVPEPGFDGWIIVGYDILGKQLDALQRHSFRGLIFDEAHLLKDYDRQCSKLCQRLVDKSPGEPIVYVLAGIPITESPSDLFLPLQLVKHPLGASFPEYARRYCGAYYSGRELVMGSPANLDELRRRIQSTLLRRTRDDVANMPAKLRTFLDVEVPGGVAMSETRKLLELLLAMRSAKNAGHYVSPEDAVAHRSKVGAVLKRARLKIALAKMQPTIDFVRAATKQGERVLVFTCFDELVAAFAEHFYWESARITSKTSRQRRHELAARFNREFGPRVMLANIAAGASRLNLTSAGQVVFNDLDWTPEHHWSAENLAYRFGLDMPLSITYMVAKGTIDEFVKEVLNARLRYVTDEGIVRADIGRTLLNVLQSLRESLRGIDPQLANVPAEQRGDEWTLEVIRKAIEAYHKWA